VLDATVNTILGMPFLEGTNPIINWKNKTIRIKYKGKLFAIPTIQEKAEITPKSPTCSIVSKNSF
jgi:hypothetical protein